MIFSAQAWTRNSEATPDLAKRVLVRPKMAALTFVTPCLTRGLASLLCCGAEQLHPQVVPVGIIGFDERELPFAPLCRHQLLAPDRSIDRRMN